MSGLWWTHQTSDFWCWCFLVATGNITFTNKSPGIHKRSWDVALNGALSGLVTGLSVRTKCSEVLECLLFNDRSKIWLIFLKKSALIHLSWLDVDKDVDEMMWATVVNSLRSHRTQKKQLQLLPKWYLPLDYHRPFCFLLSSVLILYSYLYPNVPFVNHHIWHWNAAGGREA